MEHTGIFATLEELEDLRSIARQGWMPGDIMIVTSIMQGITKDQKTMDAHKAYQLALAHGLPEIPGYYGIDIEGEFMRV